MLTYTLQSEKSKSLYIQIYEKIKANILGGTLGKDERLPSKRAFAKNLGVSVITVENAYNQLLSEGYIYSVAKSGYFVSAIYAPFPSEKKEVKNIISPVQSKTYKYDFASNGVRASNFPVSVWKRLLKEAFENPREVMLPSDAGGINELRTALCKHLKEYRNMSVSPEQIIIGAGTEYLYSLIIQLLGFDKTYATENPGYGKISDIYSANGVKCVYVDTDSSGMRTDKLIESQAQIAHLSPSHHFPTGTVMSISRRYEMLSWAGKDKDRYIIEDDYDSEFRFTGKPLPALQSIDSEGKVIYINTFTKSLSPAIRISYMVLPERLVEAFYSKLGFYSNTVSNFEQLTLAMFIERGYFEKHINRMRNYYKKIRNALLDEIKNSPLSDKLSVLEEEAGLHFLVKVDTDISDTQLIKRAEKNSVKISCLSEYYRKNSRNAPKHIVIINYSAIAKEDIAPAIKALDKCLEE